MKNKRKLILASALLLAACTPEQEAWFKSVASPYQETISPEQLYRLRLCESSDNYQATDRPVGKYRGAYQFDQRTWDGVAERHFPWLVGVDPIDAEFYWQDLMASALYQERGRSPWPHCGKRI